MESEEPQICDRLQSLVGYVVQELGMDTAIDVNAMALGLHICAHDNHSPYT